jgi:hypothetical protein
MGLSIAVERWVFLRRARSQNKREWAQMLPMLQGGQLKEVLSTASRSESAIGSIVTHGLTRLQTSRRREDLDAAMEEGMMEIVPRLERRTHYIATFDQLKLEVVIRRDAIEVGDRIGGLIQRIANTSSNAPDLVTLNSLITQIKLKFPEQRDASVLAEPDTPYDKLVQVMDAVRSTHHKQGSQIVRNELFPDIAIGDAPVVRAKP